MRWVMVLMVVCCACGAGEQERFNAAIKNAENVTGGRMEVFLGFELGQSKKEYEEHLARLVRNGEVMRREGNYQHRISSGDQFSSYGLDYVTISIIPNFCKSKLCELQLLGSPGGSQKVTTNAKTNNLFAYNVLYELVGIKYVTLSFDSYDIEDGVAYVKNNNVVMLKNNGTTCLLSYKDIPAFANENKLAKAQEEKLKLENASKM